MEIIAFINRKGGVGKSTSVVALAHALAESAPTDSAPILVVDLDAQGHAAKAMGVPKGEYPAVSDVLLEEIPIQHAIRSTSNPKIHVLPASEAMGEYDLRLAAVPGRERKIQQIIDSVSGSYSYVILDCPPGVGLVHAGAYVAADWIIVPSLADADSIEGVMDCERDLERAKSGLGARAERLGVVITMAELSTVEHRENIAEIRGAYMVLGIIQKGTVVREAARHRQTVLAYAPSSRAAEQYRDVAREIAHQIAVRRSS